MVIKVYDVYSLKLAHQEAHPESHFFDRDTLKFFGERLSSMRLLKKHSTITDCMGEVHECYCLSSPQKTPFGTRRTHWFYFDVKTLEEIIPA